jgi:hypothetical protein
VDDWAVRLVVPLGIATVLVFVFTETGGEAVATLLGALLTAIFAALTFRLLRRQDEASWLSMRPFLWCSVEQCGSTLRLSVENRSDAPALGLEALLEVGQADDSADAGLPLSH